MNWRNTESSPVSFSSPAAVIDDRSITVSATRMRAAQRTASAIAGVLGAYLVLFPTVRIRTLIFLGIFITLVNLPALVVIGFFIVIQFVEGFASLRLSGHPATEQIAFAELLRSGAYDRHVRRMRARYRARRDKLVRMLVERAPAVTPSGAAASRTDG